MRAILFATLALSTASAMTVLDLAKTAEGIFYGLLQSEKPTDISHCISDTTAFESALEKSVADLESLTFSGIRNGLREAGEAIHMLPDMVKDCKELEGDLISVAEKATIFMHPLSLIYQVGRSIWVNGADIRSELTSALESWSRGDYFEFGSSLGEALDTVFLKTTATTQRVTKRPSDEHAFDFLCGFFSAIDGVTLDEETLYNHIDGRGAMVWGPVRAFLEDFEAQDRTIDKHFWLSLHEVEHIFQEGGESMVATGAITADELEYFRSEAECLGEENFVESDSERVREKVSEAADSREDAYKVGQRMAEVAKILCGQQQLVQ